MKISFISLWFLCSIAVGSVTNGYQILFLAPISDLRQWTYFENFVHTLLNRNHDITCVTRLPLRGARSENYVEVLIDSSYNNISANNLLFDDSIQRQIYRNGLQYDVVISEEIYHDNLLMVGHSFEAPVITVGSHGISNIFDYEAALQANVYLPHMLFAHVGKKRFSEKLIDAMTSLYDRNDKDTGLSATPKPIFHRRPAIRESNLMPADLKRFMDDAKDGVIYLNFDTVINSEKMPKEKLAIFLDVFKMLKQRIVWKLDDQLLLANVPGNVLIRKRLPQKAILTHPNVVLMLTHGGTFNNFEAISRGTPTLMIPFSEGQQQNALLAEDAGFGTFLGLNEMTKASLFLSIREMIESKSYFKNAKEISSIYKDNLVQPIDEDVIWIEHTCRRHRVKLYSSSGLSHIFLDIFLLVTLGVVVIVFCIYLTLTRSWRGRKHIGMHRKNVYKRAIVFGSRKKLDVLHE